MWMKKRFFTHQESDFGEWNFVIMKQNGSMMDELLGITEPVTPEERQAFFLERIHPAGIYE